MPTYYIAVLLFRLVLPAALLTSIALRPFGISILYLLVYLWLPLVSMPNSRTFSGWCKKVLLVNMLLSICLLLLHVAWHAYLLADPEHDNVLGPCSQLQVIAQNLGFVDYKSVDPLMGTHFLAPELVMAVTSIAVYAIMGKLLSGEPAEGEPARDNKYQRYPFITNAGKYISLFLIMFSGILRPSVISALYYLVFMGAVTFWAIGKELARGYAVVCRCVMAIMSAHVALLIVYQYSYLIELLPPTEFYARVLGLTQLVKINCDKPTEFEFVQAEWTTFVSPIVILFTYYVLALETRELFKPKAKRKSSPFGKLESGKLNGSLIRGVSFHRMGGGSTQDRWRSATKKVRLIRGISPLKRMSSKRSTPQIRGLHQDSTGSVIVPDEGNQESMDEGAPPGMWDEIVLAIIGFFQVVIRSSYIATSITMMVWSIMYHSWLTFVFLMWANVVWLRQNQRSFMLNSSPVLVCYAMFLLLSQYIYSMDLNDTELPSTTKDVNLSQIGFVRPKSEACVPLLVKSLLACMFWATLRQRNQEATQRKQSSTIADMVAPLQLTVSTAASVIEKRQQEEYPESRLLRKSGDWLKRFCSRYWIYVVTIMLFIIGITGERMTIFRIIYMLLFLSFILLFQISWRLWRRLMYAFWIVLIVYSMVNLVLVYIYQFDNFPLTIQTYLKIPVKLQLDLGLEKFNKADLFVRLLTPTCFLIITIMQVHYFHKDFLEMSKLKSRSSSVARDESTHQSQAGPSAFAPTSQQGGGSEDERPHAEQDGSDVDRSIEMSSLNRRNTRHRSLKPSVSKSYAGTVTERTSVSLRDCAVMFYTRLSRVYGGCRDLLFLYLEIHLIKIVFLALMLLSVLNVSALHVPIMVMISPGLLLSHRRQQTIIILASLLLSAYFMAKMIYQIEYIPHSLFDVNCTNSYNGSMWNPTTYNNAEWVGFIKATKDNKLPRILKGYITLIALFTVHSMIMYRQQRFRTLGHIDQGSEKIMFPEVTRKEADLDLIYCLKYLVNYGFYKFGVEITLICLVGVIGSRMDIYALMYAFWLLVLVSCSRKRQACLWPFFTGYVTVLLPLQYMIAVGILPQFCVQYPWSGDDKQSYRHWFFLPYADDPPHATKIIFDYLLLLFCARQRHVFGLERRHGEDYLGGSNSQEIGQDWETPHFVNPVPDFLSVISSYLDVVKRLIFLGMLWVTLAIMFLAGTNRVNIFSMGYLIGSFIFLWQGTDFYLRPKHSILRWWTWLLSYNVCVVVVKAVLQIPGCMYNTMLQQNACWLVQLLGIGCVDKFQGGSIHSFLKMNHYKNTELSCAVPQEDIGLAWDGVCFAFLLLQRRMFHSYYFYRIIDESKATTVLASRGADLIEELRQKQMRQQEDQEMKILEKIKVKMERIKANQMKIQGQSYVEAPQHDADDEEEETVGAESERAPLVHGDSETSARGYHTPESAGSPRGFHTPISDESAPASPATTPPPSSPDKTAVSVGWVPPPLAIPPQGTPAAPPSPSSALMTVSLDAYLEPQRLSYSSPPASELMPRAHSPEESYPVFSPPLVRRRHTVASPQPRTSVISYSSRSANYSHHTCTGSAPIQRRVFTERNKERYYKRPTYQMQEPPTHQKAVRSGDYYMFDEFDDVDITSLNEDDDSIDEDMPKEMGLGALLSTAIKTDLRRAVSMRRASAPAVRAQRHLSVASDLTYPRRFQARPQQQPSKPSDETHPTHSGMVDLMMPDTTEKEISELGLEPPESETLIDKLRHYCSVAWAFIESVIVSLTRQLLRYSRDYRYVSKALFQEKKILKEKENFGIGLREGTQMIWQPFPEALISDRCNRNSTQNVYVWVNNETELPFSRKLSNISVPEIRILAPSMERGLDLPTPATKRRALPAPARASPLDSDSDSSSDSESERRRDSVYSLPSTESKDPTSLEEQEDSMFHKSRSPFVHLIYALWYAILSHTDIVCYIMVFINQIQSATILSIPLPLMVFMWGTLTIPRPTKTFWVTLIAYTEVIVLVKSMFQFEILPWNQKEIPASIPFTLPRVIGIERKSNYALYDLLLLLIVFFHRFMLKSLGLWKESAAEVELCEDALYPLTPEDTRRLAEGRGEEVGKEYAERHTKTGGIKRQPKIHEDTYTQENEKSAPDKNNIGEEEGLVRDRNVNKLELPGTSKEAEDDHYKVDDDQEPIIGVSAAIEDPKSHFPLIVKLAVKRYLRPVHQFFVRMLDPTARVTADVYAYMFMCDFFNFLVVIFGFAAFGTQQGDGGVQAYLEENKVPIPFLVMLILQFALIIIDRALYLRKFILGKILFQYGLIIGVHVWMFFVLPFITERTFNHLLPPPMWYMVKCIYLLLSAYQIRCGYPRRIIGNFLCKGYNYVNMFLFRGFMALPFVFELRTLMDWVWTDTSMTLMDWLKMEDIFSNIFLLKCSRYVEDEFPQERGVRKNPVSKYLMGGTVLAFIIAVIWFPLVLFAFGNSVGSSNPPTDITIKIRIGPFLPAYMMTAQRHNIDLFTEQQYEHLSNLYAKDRTAQTFLSNYMYDDLAAVTFNTDSTNVWAISPPELDRLLQESISNDSLTIKMTTVLTHKTHSKDNPPNIETEREVVLEPFVGKGKEQRRNPQRVALYDMLSGNSKDAWLLLDKLLPKFVKVLNKGESNPANQLIYSTNDSEEHEDTPQCQYRDVMMRLNGEGSFKYWSVHEDCSRDNNTRNNRLSLIAYNDCNKLVMYTFNDRIFPETLNFISGSGIIGLYTTFVFLASRLLRGFFSGIFSKIMFEDLPNVDRVLQMCLDIYLVREALELALEEDLFAKLVFLYRSPETMIKWTRPREEPEPPEIEDAPRPPPPN